MALLDSINKRINKDYGAILKINEIFQICPSETLEVWLQNLLGLLSESVDEHEKVNRRQRQAKLE